MTLPIFPLNVVALPAATVRGFQFLGSRWARLHGFCGHQAVYPADAERVECLLTLLAGAIDDI
jgi:hypothetical protein